MRLHALDEFVCPCGHHCQPQFMGWTNRVAQVDYYRCAKCGHFWTVPKSDLLKPTPLRRPSEPPAEPASEAMMPPDCPSCGADTPRRLDGSSADKTVWLWRCDHCGHLWSMSKIADADISPLHVRR